MAWRNPLTWPIDPWVLLGIEVTVLLYLRGGRHRRRRARPGGPEVTGGDNQPWRALAFWLGLATILFALDSPLERLARQLFWAHMTQHLLLIVVAAPLLAVAAPGFQIWRGLPLAVRRPLARTVVKHPALSGPRKVLCWSTSPTAAWVLSSGNLWFWHWPAAYNLTLQNHAAHHLEHALFLGLGLLFWAQVIGQAPFHAGLSQLQGVAYIFLASIQAWALAAVLAFAGASPYAYAQLPSQPGGISAATDQQFGAGLMWVPGSITYSIVIIAGIYRWLGDADRGGRRFRQPPVEVAAR